MPRRSFGILVFAALAMAVLAGFVVWRGDREVSAAPRGELALPGLAAKLGELGWVSLTHGKAKLDLAAHDGRWTVVQKGNYPAEQDKVRKLLLQLAELELIEPKTDRPELWPRLDLDDPINGKSTLVTVQDRGGGAVAQLIIGRQRPHEVGGGEPGVYVRRPNSEQTWLARGAFDLSAEPLAWLDRRIVDIAVQRVASVVLTAADGGAVIVDRKSADQPFAIDGPPPDAHPKNDAALAAPAGALEALDLDDVKPAAEMAIPATGVATAALTTFDGFVVGLRLSPPDQGNWVAIEVTGFGGHEAEARELSDRLSHWSFAIPAERAKLLRTTLADLLEPHGS